MQSVTLSPTVEKSLFQRKNLSLVFGVAALLVGVSIGVLVTNISDFLKLVVVIGGIIVLIATLIRIEWGLLILIFLTYTRFSDVAIESHGAPSIAKFFVVYILFCLLLRWLTRGEKFSGWFQPLIVIVVYGFIGFASILYAIEPERTIAATSDYIKDAIIIITIILLLRNQTTFQQVVWTLLFASIFLGSISVIQYLTNSFDNYFWGFAKAPILHIVSETSGHRVAGPIGDPNFYAQIMIVPIPLALDRIINEKKIILRLLSLWALGVSVLTVIFTFSRGGFLTMVIVVGLMMFIRPPRPFQLLLILLALIVLAQLIPASFTKRIMKLKELLPGSSETISVEPSLRGRTSELLVGWMMFVDHPVLGVGLHNYPEYYLSYSQRVGLDPRLEERTPHNLYLEIASETGVIGLSGFGLILFIIGKGIWDSIKRLKERYNTQLQSFTLAFTVALCGYLIAGLFIHNAYPRYLWLLIGMAFALINVIKNDQTLLNPPEANII